MCFITIGWLGNDIPLGKSKKVGDDPRAALVLEQVFGRKSEVWNFRVSLMNSHCQQMVFSPAPQVLFEGGHDLPSAGVLGMGAACLTRIRRQIVSWPFHALVARMVHAPNGHRRRSLHWIPNEMEQPESAWKGGQEKRNQRGNRMPNVDIRPQRRSLLNSSQMGGNDRVLAHRREISLVQAPQVASRLGLKFRDVLVEDIHFRMIGCRQRMGEEGRAGAPCTET